MPPIRGVIGRCRILVVLLVASAPLVGPAGSALAWQVGDPLTLAPMSVAVTVPANTAAPAIAGGPVAAGTTLTVSTGSWSGPPTSFTYQWQRDAGSGFADIAGATTSAYTIASGDTGAALRAKVTGTNTAGSATATTPAVGPVGAAVPTNTQPPAVGGTPRRGVAVSASAGAWNPTGTFTYQWQRDAGSGFAAITGATASTYTPAAGDVGDPLRVVVTATNANGATSATSAASAAVVADPPVNTVLPAVSGSATRTMTLTATPGTWTPAGASFAYQWQRDSGSGFAAITGATATTYTLVSADVGARVRVQVTATNPDASVAAVSTASAAVLSAAPVSTAAPLLSGLAKVGQVLTSSDGGWNPAPTSFAYQWQRDSGSGFADIAGATSNSYTLVTADLGARIRARVTATNADGSGVGVSAGSPVVTTPPSATTAPAAPTGTLTDTGVLIADPGVWSPTSALLTYQWFRCPAAASAITSACQVAGAGQYYTLVAADVGHAMGVRVTATSSGGSTAVNAPLTAVVTGRALTSLVAPALAAPPTIAESVHAVPGTWSVPVTARAYQWQRCAADGTGCADIPGAAAVEYTPTAADHGHQLAVRESVTSPGRTASATSTPATVADQPLPVNAVRPVASGTAQRTRYLQATHGEWGESPTAYSFQWQRCAADGTGCADIAGATGPGYQLAAADVGHAIVVAVGATNTSGTVVATSNPTAPVAAWLPVARNVPAISGTAQLPNTLGAVRAGWETTPDTHYALQWRRCAADGTGCADITGAVGQTYRLVSADVGATIRLAQIATDADGSATATSAASAIVLPARPGFARRPVLAIDGNPPQVGRLLTMTAAAWNADTTSSAPTLWRCTPRCVAVSLVGATTYTLTSADAGALMRYSETGTGPGGTTEVYATQSFGPVRAAAVAVSPPLAPGGGASLVGGSGTPLARVTVSAPAAAAAAAVRAAGAARAGAVRVTVRRRPGAAGRARRVWACRTPAAATDAAPCTSAVVLRARVTLRLALAHGQRVQVVVAPARRSAK